MLDVAVIGGGPAGIAAARACLAAGRSVRIFEARPRLGGRTATVAFAGHPVDLGAHWLHAGPINPVVRLAQRLGVRLKRAPLDRHLFVEGRRGRADEDRAYENAFARADRMLSGGAKPEGDRAASALPPLGRWRGPVRAITGLVCGRPLDEVSHADFASAEYADNLFAPEGFGALVSRLAANLPATLGCPVHEIVWSERRLILGTLQGQVSARAAIVTIPPAVLQTGAVRFSPSLPEATTAAIQGFRAAVYEHVLLRWPDAPFRGADRIATLVGCRLPGLGMLTRLDGGALHYLELDHPTATSLGRREAAFFAREALARQFGARALGRLQVLTATRWRDDPLSLSSWSVVPPGRASIRAALAVPVGGRMFFAGEATDHAQWGTVGGAWAQGERAAAEAIAALV